MRLLVLVLLLAGCAASPEPNEKGVGPNEEVGFETVVYVVRHAETEEDGTRDPALNEEGEARAARLVEVVVELVDAVFTSPLRRTQLTAAPTASAAGVTMDVVPFDEGGIEGHVAETVRRVRAVTPGSVVLVVGHSNTAPAIAGLLAGTELDDLDHEDYGTVFVVSLSPGGGVGRLETRRY